MRRILAVVLPDVALVLARRRVPACSDPLAVVVDEQSAIVAAADLSARRRGVKIGQSAVAATVCMSPRENRAGLRIVHVPREDIAAELELVLEVLASFGPTVSLRLERDDEALDPTHYDDTAWVDVTGATALAGGEKALAEGAHARIDALGHRALLALASGPRIARALARFGFEGRNERWGPDPASPGGAGPRIGPEKEGEIVIARSVEHERRLFSALPLNALPLSARARTFFRRVGLVSIGELAALPRAQVSARLDSDASARVVIDLLEGRDDTPLVAWTPLRVVAESQSFEEGVAGTEALTFVLRGMTSRLGQRLAARGEATGKMTLTLALDRSIARHARGEDAPTEVLLAIALPVPLADPDALLRTWMPMIERTELVAPVVTLRLLAEDIVHARRDQLDLSRGHGIDPNRLRNLGAELGVEIGEGRVGFFRVLDAHRPESRSVIVLDGSDIRAALAREDPPKEEDRGETLVPTRLLPEPLRIEHCFIRGRSVRGTRLVVEGRAHRVERVSVLARMERVEWWTSFPLGPVTREYVRVSLVAEENGERSEALVFHDRIAHESFLHGWLE